MHEESVEYFIDCFKHPEKDGHIELVARVTDFLQQKVLEQLAVFISQKRKERHLSVRELNRRSRVSLAVINDLEKARSMPRVESLIRLALALEISFNDVFDALKLPNSSCSYKDDKDSKTNLAIDIAKYGYDKNQVSEIMDFISFVDFKTTKTTSKEVEHILDMIPSSKKDRSFMYDIETSKKV